MTLSETIELIEKAMEGVTPDRIERLWWFLHILAKSTGTTNANDDRWNWINAFCTDFPDDTFNRAAKLGFIRATHNDLTEDSTARLTDAGQAFVSYFTEMPSAALALQLEALKRENAELREALRPFAECAPEWEGEPDSLHVFFEWNDENAPVPSLPVADFRRARALLNGEGKG